MELRPYQSDLKEEVLSSLERFDRIILQLATGGGKTIILSALAEQFLKENKIVWILVHRKELITQTLQKLEKFGIHSSVVQSDFHYSRFNRCQVVSVLTAVRRLKKLQAPDVIICDEAHHSTAKTYRHIYNNYPESKIIGVTATPVRSNGEGFDDIFETIINGISVRELIKLGFLVEPKIFAKPLKTDLSKLRVEKGEFRDDDLFEIMNNSEIYGDIVASYQQKAEGKKAIVFAVNVLHSKLIAEKYKEAGIVAEHIDGKTPKDERDRILSDFRTGKVRVLTNVNIITEGFDVPDCEVVQLARPVRSLSSYLQMVGRGLRSNEGKEYCIVLDHSDCVFYHGFPQQNRKWTLEGKKKKKKKQQFKVSDSVKVKDLKTGDIYEKGNLPENITDIELIEVIVDTERMERMDFLIEEFSSSGKPLKEAWDRFTQEVVKPTIEDISMFQRKAGYKPGWIFYQKKEFGYLTK